MKTIPVCIKLLQHHNIKKELLREICSYLNLIAIRFPELLIKYTYYIFNAVLKGHTCLTHLLYQICEAKIECIYPLIRYLIQSLTIIENKNDLSYVFQIIYLISLNHVQLVIVHMDDIICFIDDEYFQDYVFDILFSVASQMPIALENYLNLFNNNNNSNQSNYYDSYKVDKIISTVGKSLKVIT